jgi:hypothetical protein
MELVTLRHRLIQIQQQYLPQLDRSGMTPAQRIEADRSILKRTMAEIVDQMGIVHFGALLPPLAHACTLGIQFLHSDRSYQDHFW